MNRSRRLPPAVTAAVAALIATAFGGCAGQPQPATPAAPPAGGVVSSGPLPPPSSGSGSGANEVAPETALDLLAQRWERVEVLAGTDELLVHATLTGGPPCTVLGRVDLVERPDAVTVTLMVGRRPGASCDGPKPDLGFPVVTRVRLAAPLAGRAVHDGAR